jgi:hypothetical protein
MVLLVDLLSLNTEHFKIIGREMKIHFKNVLASKNIYFHFDKHEFKLTDKYSSPYLAFLVSNVLVKSQYIYTIILDRIFYNLQKESSHFIT